MDTSPEKYCQALSCVFQATVNEMKSSIAIWEDFATKCTKLQSALKVSLVALGSFLDSFQKLADLSMSSTGGTRELGASLTRWCMRHRTVEAKLKIISSSLVEQLANPLMDKIEEWKRNNVAIDKERTRDYKKARQEVKRASMDSLRIQKKARKSNYANGGSTTGVATGGSRPLTGTNPSGTMSRDGAAQAQLALAMHEVNARWSALQEAEQCSLRKLMREERGRICFFVTCFRPIIEQEVSLLSEMACFQEIVDKLAQQSADSNALPNECEQFLTDLRNSPEVLLKSFGQPSSSPASSRTHSQASPFTTSTDTLSFASASASVAHSPVTSVAPEHPTAQPSAEAPCTTALSRHESFASVGSATLRRRANYKVPASATNLQHASTVSMSTNSLASNASRSSCSSAGHVQPVVPKAALVGLPSGSAASALLCVAAAARTAAAKATSHDSGFISQDTLYAATAAARSSAPATRDRQVTDDASSGIIWMHKDDSPESALETFEHYIGQVARQLGDMSDDLPPSRADSASRGSSASPVSTWTNWPEQPGYFDPKALNAQLQARPHTVSAPGRKAHHTRPPLSDRTFEPPTALDSHTDPLAASAATHEQFLCPLPQSACCTIAEDSFEKAVHGCPNIEDFDCTLHADVMNAPADPETAASLDDTLEFDDFPAPPPADVLQRIAVDCMQQTAILRRVDTVDALPLPPPPSDYADPVCTQPSDEVATPLPTYADPITSRSLANECSPISKLIQQLSVKSDRGLTESSATIPGNNQSQYAAPVPLQYAAVMRHSRPTEQSEYAQTGVRHSSRSRPAPPQRRSSMQQGGKYAPLPLPHAVASEYQPCALPATAPARQITTPFASRPHDRVSLMQVVSMPVDIQPASGSLTSYMPLAVPMPAVCVSLGGIATCPPELNEHAGAVLRQIKTGVTLRHCAASLISDKSRPFL